MKERSRSKSQGALSGRVLNTSKESKDMDVVFRNTTVLFKIYH